MNPGLKPHATPPKVKVGDLVTLYWQGYYKVISLEARSQQEARGKGSHEPGSGVPLVKAYRLADEDGLPVKDKHIYTSDTAWVTKLTKLKAEELGLVQKKVKVAV